MLFETSPRVFVFGSNEAGRHGKGSALFARRFRGAIYGQGVGLQGNSYGIPTKDARLRVLPLSKIRQYVEDFIEFAKANPQMEFEVTRIGCGLAGYRVSDIQPLFASSPSKG